MSSTSVITYINELGESRGTYVKWDGYPSHTIPILKERIEREGVEALKRWIETGIKHGGYSMAYDTNPYFPEEELNFNCTQTQESFGYLITDEGEIVLLHGEEVGYEE